MHTEFATPEFVAWCVIRPCLLRGRYDLDQPIATDRQLKSVRALSAGISGHRIFGPWCLDRTTASGDFTHPQGFAVADVVARWSSIDAIAEACESCEANFHGSTAHTQALGLTRPRWAGCFGWLALRGSLADLPERFAARLSWSRSSGAHPWPGLWQERRISGARALEVATALQNQIAIDESGEPDDEGLDDPHRLIAALQAAGKIDDDRSSGVVAVAHMPAGMVKGKDWEWPSHCRVCLAWKSTATQCARCGDRSAPLSRVRRRSRGIRPFRDLREVLSAEGLGELADQVATDLRQRSPENG